MKTNWVKSLYFRNKFNTYIANPGLWNCINYSSSNRDLRQPRIPTKTTVRQYVTYDLVSEVNSNVCLTHHSLSLQDSFDISELASDENVRILDDVEEVENTVNDDKQLSGML